MKNSIKQKIQNSKVNFSGSLLKSLILPIVIGIIAIVLTITVNFNKGIDFKGGIIVSFNAGQEVTLTDTSVYNEYKNGIEEVLNDNGVVGNVYTVENTSIVVKVEYNLKSANKNSLIKNIKEDLVAKYYSDLDAEEVENRNLVEVDVFGSSITLKVILKTFLATIVSVLLVCAYLGFRFGLHSAVMAMLSSIGSMLLTGALIMITRIPLNTESLIVIPFVTLISVVMSFLYSRKVKSISKNSNDLKNKSNIALCDEAVRKILYGELLISTIMALCIVLFGLFNMSNSIAYLCLALFEAILSALYVNIFVMPAIFALSYVRKVKKEKNVEVEEI